MILLLRLLLSFCSDWEAISNMYTRDSLSSTIQNKGTLTSPARIFIVVKVPLRYLRPSIIYSVPCDRILQRAYWTALVCRLLIYLRVFTLSIWLLCFVVGFASLDAVHHGIWNNVCNGDERRRLTSIMKNFSISLKSTDDEREERNLKIGSFFISKNDPYGKWFCLLLG